MKLTVIGFWGGYPKVDGATSTYLLESKDSSILLDLGSFGLSKLQKYKDIQDLDAVVISHFHEDHVADIGVLQYALLVQNKVLEKNKKIPIYAPNEEGFSRLEHTFTEAVEYNPEETLCIGPFKIDFLRTNHSVPCYGMRITDGESTLVYTADSGYLQEFTDFSKNADILISDCNFYAGMEASSYGHMTSEDDALIAKEANVKNLVLSHLPQFGNLNQLKKEAEEIFKGKVVLAYEGLTWYNKEGFFNLKK